MQIKRCRFTLLDGSEIELATSTFLATADRVAAERRWPDFKLGQMTQADVSEEVMLFFLYRCVARDIPRFASTSFDEFVEMVNTYDLPDDEEEEAPDPPVALTG